MAEPILIKEQYYTKVFLGKGDLTSQIPDPRLGYFYVDASTGAAKVYDGTAWNTLGSNVVISI